VFVQWNQTLQNPARTNPASAEGKAATENTSKQPLWCGCRACFWPPPCRYWGGARLPCCNLKKATFVPISSMQMIAATVSRSWAERAAGTSDDAYLGLQQWKKHLAVPRYLPAHFSNWCSPFPPRRYLISCFLFPTAGAQLPRPSELLARWDGSLV